MPSASSSLDEECTCGHTRKRHLEPPGAQCVACSGDEERSWRHEFEPKDTLSRGGVEGVHVHEWGEWEPGHPSMGISYAYCPCGASKARRAEPEKPQEPEAERWKTGRCRDCEEPIPQGPVRCNACFWKASRAEPQEPVCTHCQGPHGTEDCKGLEEPEEGVCAHEAWEERNRSSRGRVSRWCVDCGHYMGRFDAETAPVPAPRRPPYAVAYAVEGGAQYEVAVSGDATVVAEDGALHILHPKKPVLAIVRIQPMHMEES